MRRFIAFLSVPFVALSVTGLQASPDDGLFHRMKPGDIFVVSNEENLSTGYSWRVDTRASTGLDRVAISDGGHTQPGESLPGAPGAHSWTIRALEPGRATIQFVYQRPWEPAPVRTRRVIVKISP